VIVTGRWRDGEVPLKRNIDPVAISQVIQVTKDETRQTETEADRADELGECHWWRL
jgi:hypothetical protein